MPKEKLPEPVRQIFRDYAAQRRIVPHRCANPECGKSFEGTGKARYCSDACRYHGNYLKRKQNGRGATPPAQLEQPEEQAL